MNAEPFVGIEEASRFLSVKVSWTYEQVRLGRLPSYRIGKFRRFRLSELEAWATGQTNGKNSDLLPAEQQAKRGSPQSR